MLAYWKLLMRDRLMALAPSGRRREGQAAWKAVLGWAGMTLLAVSLFAMAVLFEMVMYDQAKAMGEPQAVIALAFLACTLMTLIYSFFYVISLLFFGRDCAFVGALPIPSHGVLLAKLATVPEEEPNEEDRADLKEAADINDGTALPLEEVKSALDFSGKLNIRIPKSLHQKLSQDAKLDGVSLNQYIIYKLAR